MPTELADRFRLLLRERVGEKALKNYFAGELQVELADAQFRIAVPNPFLQRVASRKFRRLASQIAVEVLGPAGNVEFVADSSVTSTKANPQKPTNREPRTPHDSPAQGRLYRGFAEYMSGPGNELAVSGAREICAPERPGFNPLFVYGNSGVGKSHLLEAIYDQIRATQPTRRVMYLPAESFANYFTEALRGGGLPSFRQRFRGVQVFLVDDVDFFDGKPGIQAEFLHTFQHLASFGSQIVLAADRHPRLLTKTSEDLVTRFLGGLLSRIESPDEPTRKAIIDRKLEQMGVTLADGVADYLAGRFTRNVRELEGGLNCLATHQDVKGKQLTLTESTRVLAALERDCLRIIRLGDIEEAVAGLFGVEPEGLRSKRRTRVLAQPRSVAMYVARKHTGAAYSEIGRHFGNRNHSTVLSAERRVEQWVLADAEIQVGARVWRIRDVITALEQQLDAA